MPGPSPLQDPPCACLATFLHLIRPLHHFSATPPSFSHQIDYDWSTNSEWVVDFASIGPPTTSLSAPPSWILTDTFMGIENCPYFFFLGNPKSLREGETFRGFPRILILWNILICCFQGGREVTQKDTRSKMDTFWGVKNCPYFLRLPKFKIVLGGNI